MDNDYTNAGSVKRDGRATSVFELCTPAQPNTDESRVTRMMERYWNNQDLWTGEPRSEGRIGEVENEE